ncbi:hypothetical protein ACWIG5_19225 [Streptomyces lydicus]
MIGGRCGTGGERGDVANMLTRTPAGRQRRFDERRHLTLSVTRPVLDTVVRERALRAAAG